MKTNPDHLVHSFNHTEHSEGNRNGLTKREYFAAMAMQGYIAGYSDVSKAHSTYIPSSDYECISAYSVELADALINALNKSK